jgi:Domain of unknown function (DUF4304)
MEEIFNNLIKNHVAPFLKTSGFKKQKNHFYQKKGDFTFSFSFSIDPEFTENGAYFYLFCGISSDAFEQMSGRQPKLIPKAYDNIFQHGFNEITGDENDRFLLENSSDLTVSAKEIIGKIKKVMEFYATITSLEILMDHCLDRNYLVHHEDQFRYLAIISDEEKSAAYLIKIKAKLDKISENAYQFYAEKLENFKVKYAK